MRALLCTNPGPEFSLEIGDVPDLVPGPGEVVIDVKAAGLNFPDTLIVRGQYQLKPEPPFSPGAEAAGLAAAIGDGVDLAVGTPVVGLGVFGAFAEQWVVPASTVMPLPPGLGFAQGAGFGLTYGTAYYALKQQGRLEHGEALLVLGAAGGVGSAAVQIGKAMGATVIAAAGSDEKLAFAADCGADLTINYVHEDLKARVRELTAGNGVDVVFDPVGGDMSEPALRVRRGTAAFSSSDLPQATSHGFLSTWRCSRVCTSSVSSGGAGSVASRWLHGATTKSCSRWWQAAPSICPQSSCMHLRTMHPPSPR